MRRPIKDRKQKKSQFLRSLRCEALEPRYALSGIVDITVAGNALVLTGDASNNHVTIEETSVPFSYRISGLDGTLLELAGGTQVTEHTVTAINDTITVELGTGNDTFEVESPVSGGMTNIYNDLIIFNDLGSNSNRIANTHIGDDLIIEKIAGTDSNSMLEIVDSEIEGDTVVDNSNGGADGDSMTIIDRSVLEGQLAIYNGFGADIIDIKDSDVGNDAGGDVDIYNGDGGAQVILNATENGTNTIYGNLSITNGANPIAVGVVDEVSVRRTDIQLSLTILNGDGDTEVSIQESRIGTDLTSNNLNFVLENEAGIDQFLMSDSVAYWMVDIDHDEAANEAWGSSTDVVNSEIGVHPLFNGAAIGLRIRSDDADATINLTDNTIHGRVELYTFLGADILTLTSNNPISELFIRTDDGDDYVVLDQQRVTIDTDINLEAGIDTLELLNATALETAVALNGGAGINDEILIDPDVTIVGGGFPGFELP